MHDMYDMYDHELRAIEVRRELFVGIQSLIWHPVHKKHPYLGTSPQRIYMYMHPISHLEMHDVLVYIYIYINSLRSRPSITCMHACTAVRIHTYIKSAN